MTDLAVHPSTCTEVEAVADAVLSLMIARLISFAQLDEACRAVGIAHSDVRDARIRREGGRYRPPRPADCLPTVAGPAGEPKRPPIRELRFNPGPEPDLVLPPEPKERFCSTCELWQHENDFSAGKRTCKKCLAKRAKNTRLTPEREQVIEQATMRYLASGAGAVNHCGTCGDKLNEGDAVVANGVALHHARHGDTR